ncbi:hypothetical protein K6Y31_20780 [Motilimonas cestriensis]|uniref:Uncharacterized protein n=1 Tax=Motilimonas cestriensis TaxID=2742685 RepID=A0ABS8WHK5_9GAMM|nr:hypothetical protein [Motilimonas cestriensis]MCE2597213.1 hypothetical protein [Motilimonas cestriensis]
MILQNNTPFTHHGGPIQLGIIGSGTAQLMWLTFDGPVNVGDPLTEGTHKDTLAAGNYQVATNNVTVVKS